MPGPFDQLRQSNGFFASVAAGTVLASLVAIPGTVYQIEIEIFCITSTINTRGNATFFDNGIAIEQLFVPYDAATPTNPITYLKTYGRYTVQGTLQIRTNIVDATGYIAFLRATPLRGLGVAS